MSDLKPESLAKILVETFPSQNDWGVSDFQEELGEAQMFGIVTEADLRALLRKHRDELLEIDRSPLSAYDEKLYRREEGEAWVTERLSKGFWFALPALFRLALELEFGEAYEAFTRRRDGLE